MWCGLLLVYRILGIGRTGPLTLDYTHLHTPYNGIMPPTPTQHQHNVTQLHENQIN